MRFLAVAEAQERLEAAWVQDLENREDAFTDLKFLAGDQWPNEIRLQREPSRSIHCLANVRSSVVATHRLRLMPARLAATTSALCKGGQRRSQTAPNRASRFLAALLAEGKIILN